MWFVISFIDCSLPCTLVDAFVFHIIELNTMQVTIIVSVEFYLSYFTSNKLELQGIKRFKLSFFLKLEVKLTSAVSREYTYKLVTISLFLWKLKISRLLYGKVRISSVLMTVGSRLHIFPIS